MNWKHFEGIPDVLAAPNSQSYIPHSDYNKLRYNYSFLKSEHENIKVRFLLYRK